MADGGNLIAGLEGVFVPASAGHAAGAGAASAPFLNVAFIAYDVQIHPHVRVAPIEFRHGAFHRGGIRHVVAVPGVVREGGESERQQANDQASDYPSSRFHDGNSSSIPLDGLYALYVFGACWVSGVGSFCRVAWLPTLKTDHSAPGRGRPRPEGRDDSWVVAEARLCGSEPNRRVGALHLTCSVAKQ